MGSLTFKNDFSELGSQRSPMRFGHFPHALESEIIFRHRFRRMCSAKSLLCMTTVNPGRGESCMVCRRMIMKQAFGGVQDLMFLKSRLAEFLDHVFEVARIGFV